MKKIDMLKNVVFSTNRCQVGSSERWPGNVSQAGTDL